MTDLAVIGGGWAGCSAARHASRRGLRVALFESAPVLGGRASSFIDQVSGESLDYGQHLFLGAYRETLALLSELGTRPFVAFQQPLSVPYLMADGRLEMLQAAALPGPLSLGLGLARFQPWDSAARRLLTLGLRGGCDLWPAYLGHLSKASGRISVADWLKRCGQDRRSMALIWEPMVLAALNARPEAARLREFLSVLGSGFLRGGFSASLGMARAPLAKLLHPLSTLLRAQGSEVHVGTAASRVESLSDGTWRIHLQGGPRQDCAKLLIALPARRAVRLLDPSVSGRLGLAQQAGRPQSAIINIWLWSKVPLLPRPMLAFGPQGDVSAEFHWGFSQAVDGGWRTTVVTSAADEIAAFETPALLSALAGFLASRGRPFTWERARVLRERSATPIFEPGGPERIGQATCFPGLALAGDWTETGLPATIEGAVRSGRLAFEALSFDTR